MENYLDQIWKIISIVLCSFLTISIIISFVLILFRKKSSAIAFLLISIFLCCFFSISIEFTIYWTNNIPRGTYDNKDEAKINELTANQHDINDDAFYQHWIYNSIGEFWLYLGIDIAANTTILVSESENTMESYLYCYFQSGVSEDNNPCGKNSIKLFSVNVYDRDNFKTLQQSQRKNFIRMSRKNNAYYVLEYDETKSEIKELKNIDYNKIADSFTF